MVTGWDMTLCSDNKCLMQAMILTVPGLIFIQSVSLINNMVNGLLFVATRKPRPATMKTLSTYPPHSASIFTDKQPDAPDTPVDSSTSASYVKADTLNSDALQNARKPPKTAPAPNPLPHPPVPNLPPPDLKTSLPTPVNPLALNYLLQGFEKRQYLVDGFTNGFKFHFQGLDCPVEVPNNSTVKKNPKAVDQKLAEELAANRIAGPFDLPL